MTYTIDAPCDFRAYERQAMSRKAVRQTFYGGVALASAGLTCIWILNVSLSSNDPEPAPRQAVAMTSVVKAMPTQSASMLDIRHSLGAPPTTFSKTDSFESRWAIMKPESFESRWAALSPAQEVSKVAVAETRQVPPPAAAVQVAEAVPMPSPRPATLRSAGPSRQEAAQENKAVALATPPEKPPTIFEKLFGKLRPESTTLAYAAPDGGVSNEGVSLTPGRYDRQTAVYDISARTVYLPDGTKLEAHSGLGSMLDDPQHVDKRMRGPTPPATYNLTMRESLFHGVEALRLNPVDSDVYGRTGLLAHTYMLGPNGDSNGCVSFRDYNRFLQAYKRQDVKKLVVVAHL